MSRWHKSFCRAPEIYIDGETPRCRHCDGVPKLEDLISTHSKPKPPWEAPPDKQLGKLNLHWPSCVPYRRLGDSCGSPNDKTGKTDTASTSTPGSTTLDRTPSSYIYDKILRSDELRLIRMEVAPTHGKTYPIHVNIEIYPEDHCPEYETLSYAWGGENGDQDQVLPLYIGPYWDVMLQTRNLWDALQYLRPYRGLRMVWIDAICINQNNTSEREQQVAKMWKIYNRCLRTVVWLGVDIAKPSQLSVGDPYPTRYSIADLVSGNVHTSITLAQLLKLKYFERVWIIQELILTPQVILPVQGLEFIGHQSKLIEADFQWEQTDIPWFQDICTGSSPMLRNIYEIMQCTWKSCATDPRDKIFGTLGLAYDDAFSFQIRADYSLSKTEVHIGAIAHILLNLREPIMLLNSLPRIESRTLPTWLSDFDDRDSVEYVWKMRALHQRFPSDEFWHTGPIPDRWYELFNRSPKGGHIIKILNRKPRPPGRSFLNLKPRPRGRSLFSTNPEARWWHNACVDSCTAALSINLIHLFDFDSRPKELKLFPYEDTVLRISEITANESCLWLITPGNTSLSSAITPGLTEVFAVLNDAMSSFFLLFLRRRGSSNDYTVLFSCPCGDLGIYVPNTCLYNDPPTLPRSDNPLEGDRDYHGHWTSKDIQTLSPHDLIDHLVSNCMLCLDLGHTAADAFPDVAQHTRRDPKAQDSHVFHRVLTDPLTYEQLRGPPVLPPMPAHKCLLVSKPYLMTTFTELRASFATATWSI